MGAVACAALSGDIAMVRRLVSMKASLEATKIPALWEAALPPNASPLIMTLTRGKRGEGSRKGTNINIWVGYPYLIALFMKGLMGYPNLRVLV